MIRQDFSDNKYTVIFTDNGHMEALRYGEKWRDLTGDGLVLAMLQEIDDLKEQNNLLNQEIDSLYDTLAGGSL